MVAISGKLQRAPDAARQWLMPTRKISLNDFKTLLQRRSRALQSNPNPNPNSQPQSDGFKVNEEKLVNELKGSTADDDCLVIPNGELLVENSKDVLPENEEKLSEDELPLKDDILSNKEKRKKEVEEKLQVLNERKHKLVQVLKQILHAEEELRRRNNVQGITITGRPIVSLQVDVTITNTNTNDCGSMSRQITPRENGADVEGLYVDDVSNQIMHSRNMTTCSMSPSSDSLHRRPPFSMVPNASRGSLGVVGSSPSRFAPTPTSTSTFTCNGQQQQINNNGNGNVGSVCVSGTNYVASSPSPSPAGSAGGTSVFRDANPNLNTRLPSPWN